MNISLSRSERREIYWAVTQIKDAPDGFTRDILGINNKPGCESRIIANANDELVIFVLNLLSVPTSLHWHGISQNGTTSMDGPSGVNQCPIPPGGSFTYVFTCNKAGPSGGTLTTRAK